MALPLLCTFFLACFLPCSLNSHCNQCDAFHPDLPLATQEKIHKQGFSYSSSGTTKRSLSASMGRPADGRVDFCYKRLGKTPRNDKDTISKETTTVMEIAEDLEEELKKSMNRNETVVTEQSFIGCLDGWIWAHRNDHDTMYYGDRMENVLRMMESLAVAQQQQQGDDSKESSSSSSIVIMSVDPYATVIHLWVSSVEEDGAVLRALRILALMEGNQQIIQQAPIQLRLIQYNKILKGLVWSDQTYHVAIKLLESMYNKSIFRLLPNDDEGGDDSKMKDSSPSSLLPSKKIQFKVSIMPDTKSFATVMTPLLQKEGIMDPTTHEVLSDDEELLVMLTRKASELHLLNNFLLRTIEKGLKDEEKMKFLLQQLHK